MLDCKQYGLLLEREPALAEFRGANGVAPGWLSASSLGKCRFQHGRNRH